MKLFLLHYLLFYLFITVKCAEDCDDPDHEGENQPSVVVFLFAKDFKDKTNAKNNEYTREDGTKALNFTKQATVDPCTSEKMKSMIKGLGKLLLYNKNKTNSDCSHLLKRSLMSLFSYAKNSLHLTTAIASLTEDSKVASSNVEEITRQDNQYFYNFQSEGDTKVRSDNVAQSFEKNDFEKLPFDAGKSFDNADYPEIKMVNSEGVENINLYNAFPNENKKFNNIDKWSRKRARYKRELLLSPPEVEVFKIPSTKHLQDTLKFSESREIPIGYNEEPDSAWDFWGLMPAIRQSYFSPLFPSSSDIQTRMANEEDRLNPNLIGQIREPTLFELVKRTLRQASSHSPNGYIMTVMGGNISDVDDPYSDLMQAAKFVVENTDDKKTLIIISGTCSDGNSLGIRETTQSEGIPVYARGRGKEILTKARTLCDVPDLVKKCISKYRKKKKAKEDLHVTLGEHKIKLDHLLNNLDFDTVQKVEKKRHIVKVPKNIQPKSSASSSSDRRYPNRMVRDCCLLLLFFYLLIIPYVINN